MIHLCLPLLSKAANHSYIHSNHIGKLLQKLSKNKYTAIVSSPLHTTMSSSDKTKISTSIPTFNGTNYCEWADAIKSFMWYSGVWFLIEGYGSDATAKVAGIACPTLANTTPNNAAEIASWDEKNNKALGTIMMYMAANLKRHVTDKYTALAAWTTLKDKYEKPRVVGTFVTFQKLFNAALLDRSAFGPQIDSMIESSTQVNNAGIKVSE